MISLRDIVIFLAGAEAFHTLSHILLPVFVEFPLKTNFIDFTASLNAFAILGNIIITALLLWWASHLSKNHPSNHSLLSKDDSIHKDGN